MVMGKEVETRPLKGKDVSKSKIEKQKIQMSMLHYCGNETDIRANTESNLERSQGKESSQDTENYWQETQSLYGECFCNKKKKW